MGTQINYLNDYGYIENVSFNSKSYDVTISPEDNIISVTDNGSLLATVQLSLENETLSLVGKDGKTFSSVELPSSTSSIESAYYNEETQELVITLKLADGTTKEIKVSFASMLEDYAKKEDVEKNTQAIQTETSERTAADTELAQKDIEHDAAISGLTQMDEELMQKNLAHDAAINDLTLKDAEFNEKLALKADKEELTNLATKDEVLQVSNELSNKVPWTDISTEDNPNRKSIVLANHDTILGTDTSGNTRSILMVSKWDKVDLGTSLLDINLNVPKGNRPTIQEAGQTGEEAHKMAYLSDIPLGVYSLGEIESFNNLADRASAKGICDNQDNVILTFKITASSGKESGFIINTRYGNKISQALYWKQSFRPEMSRTLTIDEEDNVDNPPFYPYTDNKIYVDMVPGKSLFALTTSATSEEIQSALTDSINDKTPLTAEQLDNCLKYGYYVLDSTLRTPIFIGWDGQGYTFTSVGLSSPKGQVVLSTITIMINDGTYSVKRDGETATLITASNISNDATIKQLTEKIAELESRIEALESK